MGINERLRSIRKNKGITQTYIAEKLGKTVGWYNNIEKGRRKLSAEDAKNIASLLNVKIEDIFF